MDATPPDPSQTGPEIFLKQVRQEFWGLGLVFRAFGFGVKGLADWVFVSGLKVSGFGPKVEGLGFRATGF